MVERIEQFSQEEYTRILETHEARSRGLSQGECEGILMNAGASYDQAKNGAYVYLHHGTHMSMRRRGSQTEYDQILDDFDGGSKSSQECIRHLESMDFSYGQAHTAVHKYRVSRGLIRKNR